MKPRRWKPCSKPGAHDEFSLRRLRRHLDHPHCIPGNSSPPLRAPAEQNGRTQEGAVSSDTSSARLTATSWRERPCLITVLASFSSSDAGCDSIDSSGSIDSMAILTIRRLDEKTKTRLRVRAAHHGRSMEEEAREILRSALTASSPARGNLAEAIHRRLARLGGLEFELPRRDAMRRAPKFAE
jgi:antitoxin FitA